MKTFNDKMLLLIRLMLRPVTGKAGYIIAVTGLFIISPPFVIDIFNLLLAKASFGQLPQQEPKPISGTFILLIGTFLIFVNHVWRPRLKIKEVIGIRHNSLGSFPKEDVRSDLPLLQRLENYRELDIDHSDSYAQGILDDHPTVFRRLERVPQELSGLLSSAPNSPIAYYGLPHVPLAFYLGFLLSDNKYQMDLYDLNNQSGRWNQLAGLDIPLKIDTSLDQMPKSDRFGDVVVAIGISYPVHKSEIEELNLHNVLTILEINARTPKRQIITSHGQIDQVCAEFRRGLEAIKNQFPNRQRIHIFYAGPVSLCFALGRCVSERIDPEIIVYNYSSKTTPRYSWSISFNSPRHASAVFHSTQSTGGDHAPAQYA